MYLRDLYFALFGEFLRLVHIDKSGVLFPCRLRGVVVRIVNDLIQILSVFGDILG